MGKSPHELKNMDPEDIPHQQNRVLGLSIASVIAIVLVLVGVMLFAQNRVHVSRQTVIPKKDDTKADSKAPRMSSINGRMGMTVKGAATSFKKGDTITLFIYADAPESLIDGYDAVVNYDSARLTFDSVSSTLEDMEVHSTDNELDSEQRELVITGIRSSKRKEPFLFNNTGLVEVSFVAEQAGDALVDLIFEPGSATDSNIIDNKNQDILNNAEGITVTIR